jgi:hypothetical protein
MTIFDEDGQEKEQVPLHTITEKSLLHQLMKEKGFVQMSPEEIVANQQSQGGSLRKLGFSNWNPFAEEKKDYLGEMGPSYKSMFGLYGVALLLLAVMGQVARRRRLKRRR